MTASIITGVVPILITPFDSQGRIDVDSLQNLIDFNINSGVHGIGIANGSEIFKLNSAISNTTNYLIENKIKAS